MKRGKKPTTADLIRTNAMKDKPKVETRQTGNGGSITAPGGKEHATELAESHHMGRVISTPVRLVRYRTLDGPCQVVLLFVTRHGKVRTIGIEPDGVRVRTRDREELRHMSRINGTVPKAAARMRQAGKDLGISEVAAKLLSGL